MQYRDTAIFSDLDGTLFDSFGNVSQRNREAIARYTDAGGIFAIATGRCPENMLQYLEGVAVNGPCILLNGGAIYDPPTDRFLTTNFADKDALNRVVRRCLALYPLADIQIYTPHRILYVTPEATVNRPFWELHRRAEFVSIDEAERDPWFKALLFGAPDALSEMLAWIEAEGLDARFDRVFGTTDIVPGSRYLELIPRGCSKGSLLDECRKLPCYRGRTFFGVGDYCNDLELLASSDVACCPLESHPDILRLSKIVLPSNNDSAIAALIDRIPAL